MAAKPLTDPARMLTALQAAAYMRWVEVRKRQSPSPEMVQQAIRGILDGEGFSYKPDEPQMIEILALSLNVDMVENFIRQSGMFEKLERAAAQLRAVSTLSTSANVTGRLSKRKGLLVILLLHIAAGIVIGIADTSLSEVFISSLGYGFVAWFLVVLLAGKSGYKPGTTFFGSPALTRFIVWWTTAFATSVSVGILTYGVRQFV
jgi:hypothetical protein